MASLLDLFAAEYGWSIEQTLAIPCDVLQMMVHTILNRRGVRTYKVDLQKDTQHEPLADKLGRIWQIDTAD